MRKLHSNYTFTLDLEEEPIKYMINPYHLEQILVIFLDNAIKYDKDRCHIMITTEMKEDHFDIVIMDHGIGIPEKEIEAIFDRFYRVDKSRSREMGGNDSAFNREKAY
ncbi:ATP-binding protein [Salinicoccus siamensis]|uniref:ATP-binding protein n=1 Tax=Salinicoccus siamensis TaxID=381830 RepID=UPI003623AAD8